MTNTENRLLEKYCKNLISEKMTTSHFRKCHMVKYLRINIAGALDSKKPAIIRLTTDIRPTTNTMTNDDLLLKIDKLQLGEQRTIHLLAIFNIINR